MCFTAMQGYGICDDSAVQLDASGGCASSGHLTGCASSSSLTRRRQHRGRITRVVAFSRSARVAPETTTVPTNFEITSTVNDGEPVVIVQTRADATVCVAALNLRKATVHIDAPPRDGEDGHGDDHQPAALRLRYVMGASPTSHGITVLVAAAAARESAAMGDGDDANDDANDDDDDCRLM
mmetsp:Transcript_16014/g.39630  ORF Transcript_16014/g.39630 Transcript_16014/m.39630 type:complete len:181 (+) Transcript_16014:228-770(+)